MAGILIIDDEPQIRELLIKHLNELDQMPMVAETLADGLEMVASGTFDLIFLDVNLPDGNGIEALPLIKNSRSEPEVIIITGEGDEQGAKMAIDSGAWDYILKPFSGYEIKLQVKRSLDFRASKKALNSSPEKILNRSSIIGSSPKLLSRLNMVAQCAKSDANVLITGQTGTGKELFAKVVHMNSRQEKNNFVVVDCASLPEQLVESVLFGHVKGAYTGADSNQDGLVKKADGGTLFLDEIGELPLSIQKKFLRILQERRFKPVGGTNEVVSHFRLVSATNRNLEEMVKENQFRNDLLFRLRTIHIDLPPLKECKEDIKDLTLHYIYTLCNHHGFENKGFVSEFLKALESYDWPGNIRELISSLEKAILADPASPILYPNCLPNPIRIHYIQSSMNKTRAGCDFKRVSQTSDKFQSIDLPDNLLDPIKPLKQVKDVAISIIEKIYLEKLMQSSNGDLDKAGTLSCISKSRIYSLLKKYNISRSV
ncbi:sigma-54-dependent transcriptional regulator [Desulfobacula toluolica]|uniref:Two component system response regulator, sigma54-specific n=1 Tax=Desulfobacula toluolica (strain DSM 7467 / Tol2) TaxID=651182 RepID=K0NCL6_DESTT|nr:sigma-54 dependent transcriptional regulator [Desulfobacula toluolica]CCK82274.1 two component system response regulator, sigma54-specific [Desulfobacula toluolica Tol2]